VSLFRLAALVCFALAAVSLFGWAFNWTLGTELGLIAAGLALWVAASLDGSPLVGRGD